MKLLERIRGLRQKTEPISPVGKIHPNIVFWMNMEGFKELPKETQQAFIEWAKQNFWKDVHAWHLLRMVKGYADFPS